jgi:hypothetical protein
VLSLATALSLRDGMAPIWGALPGLAYFLSAAIAPVALRLAGPEPAR